MAQFNSQGPAVGIKPGQARIMKFVLSADDWLQSPSVSFTCTVRNRSEAAPLRFLGSLPNVLLRTVRMYISGIPVEISEDYNRVHAMFTECLSKDHKVMEATKGVPLKEPYMSAAASYATGDVGSSVGISPGSCRHAPYGQVPPPRVYPSCWSDSEVVLTKNSASN